MSMDIIWNNLRAQDGLFQVFVFLYLLSSLSYLIERLIFRESKVAAYLSSGLLASAFVLQFSWFIHRWISNGQAPIRTRFESLILYCLCITVVYIAVEILHQIRLLGVFTTIIGSVILVYAVVNRDLELVKLPPALQSGWFVPHVVTYFFAYGALTIAFCLALMYQFFPNYQWNKENGILAGRSKKTSSFNLEEMCYETTKFGFVFLTWGLIMGAIWAKFAWGTYWGWDPKENWALITWLIFLTILHVRYIPGWKGRATSALVIVGYLAIIFTYLGMKYLPVAKSSLHVYQG